PKEKVEGQPEIVLGGWPVIFREQLSAPVPGGQVWLEKGKTDAGGMVAARWKAPADKKLLTFAVRYAPEHKDTTAEDGGWVYCLPTSASLLIVDVERSLAQANLKDWEAKNILDIPAQADALRAMTETAKKKKVEPVYLACAVPGIMPYRKVRGWRQSTQL